MQCVPSATVDQLVGPAATAAAPAVVAIVIDEIGNQVDITANASTSSGHLLMMMLRRMVMMVMLLIAAAATTAVVTFPFIEREMGLGLVESILQLGDASPTFTGATASLMLMLAYYCCC